MKIKNKKGLGYTEIIFIVVNAIVFSILMIFIYSSSTNSYIYEQTYSKQIALIIDSAKPNTTVIIDVSEGIKLAKKSNMDMDKIFQINNATKEVFVKLNDKGGYSFYYISNYSIDLKLDNDKLNMIIK